MNRFEVRRNEVLFYIGLFIWIIKDFLSCLKIYNMNTFQIICFTIGPMVLFCLGMVNKLRKNLRALLYVILVLLSCVAYLTSGVVNFLFFLLAIVAASDIDKEEIFTFINRLITLLLVVLTVTFFVHSMIIGEWATYSYANGNSNIRPSFYMIHPNNYSQWLFTNILLFWYRGYHRMTLGVRSAILLSVAAFCYVFPQTRTTIVALIVVWLLDVSNQMFSRKTNRIIRGCVSSFTVIISYVCMFMYHLIPNIEQLNEMVSGRLYMSNSAFKIFGITLFGNRIQLGQNLMYHNGTPYYIRQLALDNTYTRLLICSGIIVTVAFVIIYAWIILKAEHAQDTIIAIWIVSLIFYGFSEPIVTDIVFSPVLLLCGELFISGDIPELHCRGGIV